MPEIAHGFQVLCRDGLQESRGLLQGLQVVGVVRPQGLQQDPDTRGRGLLRQLRKEAAHPLPLLALRAVIPLHAASPAAAHGPEAGADGQGSLDPGVDISPPVFVICLRRGEIQVGGEDPGDGIRPQGAGVQPGAHVLKFRLLQADQLAQIQFDKVKARLRHGLNIPCRSKAAESHVPRSFPVTISVPRSPAGARPFSESALSAAEAAGSAELCFLSRPDRPSGRRDRPAVAWRVPPGRCGRFPARRYSR